VSLKVGCVSLSSSLIVLTFHCHDAVRIEANIERPERNREVLVFPIVDIPGEKNQVFTGYYIMTPMDIRFVMDEPTISFYNARVFTNKSVLIKLPGWLYSPLNDREEFKQRVTDNVTNAMDDCRHAYYEDKSRREWKYLLLDFPDDHELSSKEIIDEAVDDETLKLEIVPIAYKIFKKKKGPPQCLTHWACWKVARTDVKSKKRGKVEPGKELSEAASLLADLYISDGDEDGMEGM
jgi:hypothetical protein